MSHRRFEFTDAKSHKVWSIHLDGSTHTVQFGRIGTAGQTQTKEFASDAEARRSYEKLIDEKLRKGYVEVTDGSSPPSPASTSAPTKPLAAGVASAGTIAEDPKPLAPPSREAPTTQPGPTAGIADISRVIRLDPEDWFWATWRPLTPLPRPSPRPFDQHAALARLSKVTTNDWWQWQWSKAWIAPALTREEAHFWFTAITSQRHDVNLKQLMADLARQKFTGEIALRAVRGRIGPVIGWLPPEIMLPLAELLSLDGILDLLVHHDEIPGLDASFWGHSGSIAGRLVAGFRRYIRPFLNNPAREMLCARLRPMLDPTLWPSNSVMLAPAQFHLAACLGLHSDVETLIAGWEDDRYSGEEGRDHYHRPQEVVFGLGDPTLMEATMRRLKLRLREPGYVRAWLAHTEYTSLDFVAASILAAEGKEAVEALLETFALVEAPEAAPYMLQLVLESKAPRVARQWLEKHPDHAIAGLVPVATGRGRLAEAASDFLRSLKRKGYEVAIRLHLQEEAPEVVERVRSSVLESPTDRLVPFDEQRTPEWLREAAADPGGLKAAKRPAWIDLADLPPVVVGGHRLNEAQVDALLFSLQNSKLAEADALLRKLKENADRTSLDAFVWRLFEQWLAEGAPSKENWALRALGVFGSDAVALKLTPLVRQWPGESQHPRAVLGLECLRAIGTDTALMQINGIANKVKFKGLKAKALECMEAIAKERGLTRAELEDRIVPDCDLDERGSRTFDFGPRQFRMLLGPDLKPVIREESGKIRPDLPKPTSKDDAERANAAVADWKLLKKQVADVAKVQAVRLEQAMVTGRRWPVAAFEMLLVRHPLVTNLVHRLIWGSYDEAGSLAATFRVTEDATYAKMNDDAFTPEGIGEVGIVHPLHLTPGQRSVWGELLSDYEIVPPFPQLGRPIYTLEPGEAEKTVISRFGHVKIPAVSLVGTLERLDWARGIPEDGGMFHEHTKAFYGANVTAVVEYEGVPVGYMVDWDDQKIDRCYFFPGIYRPEIYPKHPDPHPLGQIDPVVISEVLADLTALASKGK